MTKHMEVIAVLKNMDANEAIKLLREELGVACVKEALLCGFASLVVYETDDIADTATNRLYVALGLDEQTQASMDADEAGYQDRQRFEK